MTNFITNLNYALQNKEAFLDYLGNYLFPIIITILFAVFIGWLTRKIWKKRRSIIIPLLISFSIFLFLSVFVGVSLGRPDPWSVSWLVYSLIVISFWAFGWVKKKIEKDKSMLNFGMALLLGLILVLSLISIFATNFIANKTHYAVGARITSVMSELRGKAEIIYNKENSYSSFSCNYSKGISALCDEIDRHCIYIRGNCKGDDVEGGKQDVIIHSIKNRYCAYTSLLQASTWYCIDSSGVATEVTVNPGQSGYCTKSSFTCPRR